MIRAIIYAIVLFLVVCVIGTPIMLFVLLIRLFSVKASRRITAGYLKFFSWCTMKTAGSDITVIGRENILPANTPALYVANHRSYLDVVSAFLTFPGAFAFVGKKEFKKVPFISWWMMLAGCIFLDRDNPRAGLNAIIKSAEKIKNGDVIWIFPEGTRYYGDGLLPYHEGSFKIAEKAGCPIVPVCFNRTEEIFERQQPKVRRAHVVVSVAPAIDTALLSKEEKRRLSDLVRNITLEMYNKAQQLNHN